MSETSHSSENPSLPPFEFESRTRLIFGINSVERIGEMAKNLPAKRILLVTDAGIVAAGHADRVRKILAEENLFISVFDQVRENPTTRCVESCLQVARENRIDALIGLGGGSSMDTAKGCNFLLTNGGEMKDYWGVGKATKPMLPLIAIPTTAGTGSECQSAALIADEITHQKMACLDPKAAARIALLDPALTLSQPKHVTACTGIDAIAHALETGVTRKRNPISQVFSREAFRLTAAHFERVLENPADLTSRSAMLLGAAIAGLAIENSMLGAAHAAANPLTSQFGIAHGQAVGIMLPHVIRFNSWDKNTRQIYEDMAKDARLSTLEGEAACAELIDWLQRILRRAELPASLSECDLEQSSIPGLAREAAAQWTASFNPRAVNEKDFREIYENAF